MQRELCQNYNSLQVIMKRVSIVCALLLGVTAVCSATTDYCAANLCSGSRHIGCRNNGAFGPKCPKGKTQLVQISDSLKAKIIDSHNAKRNTLASGKLPNFQPAERMATMQWDNELAFLSELNVKTCAYRHDRCRNTNAFKYSGQNLAKQWWTSKGQVDEKIILHLIDLWWSEHKDARQSDLDYYTTPTRKKIGHFTVMAADRNIALGCAAIKHPEKHWSTLTLACNYATTNVIGNALYKSGKTASKCQSGTNPKYSGLCSPAEKYDVNEFGIKRLRGF